MSTNKKFSRNTPPACLAGSTPPGEEVLDIEDATGEEEESILDDFTVREEEELSEVPSPTLNTNSMTGESKVSATKKAPQKPKEVESTAVIQLIKDCVPHGPRVNGWAWKEVFPDTPFKTGNTTEVPYSIAAFLQEKGYAVIKSIRNPL